MLTENQIAVFRLLMGFFAVYITFFSMAVKTSVVHGLEVNLWLAIILFLFNAVGFLVKEKMSLVEMIGPCIGSVLSLFAMTVCFIAD